MDTYPAAKQRAALLEFAAALDSAATAFRRDDCGDPVIKGSRGHIYAVPGGWLIYCARETIRAWTAAKKLLAFCAVTQDGDTEGMLLLDRLPNPDEAEIIRQVIGVHKRPSLDEGQLAALRQRGKAIGGLEPPKPQQAVGRHKGLQWAARSTRPS